MSVAYERFFAGDSFLWCPMTSQLIPEPLKTVVDVIRRTDFNCVQCVERVLVTVDESYDNTFEIKEFDLLHTFETNVEFSSRRIHR